VTLLRCEEAAFGYEGKAVVRGLNFSLERGDYLCVAGENGSGKSTLLRGLLGFLSPEGGRVLRPGLGNGDTGYLPQESGGSGDFPASVFEVVLSGRLGRRGIRPFYSSEDRRAAEEHLERLGMADLRRRCFRELSGGQRRRVLLARALCAARTLLVLDEPAAGLDPLVRGEVYRLLERVNREQGMGILMVSHDLDEAIQSATKILHLDHAQIFFGNPGEYRASPWGRSFLSRPAGVPGGPG
jgi:zinc transport system ATP-binding protein